jgi:hypothetical protein
MGLFDTIRGLFGGGGDDERAERAADRPADDERTDGRSAGDRRAADRSAEGTPGADGPEGEEPAEPGPEWFEYKAQETVAEWAELDLDFSLESVERLDEHAGSDDNPVRALADDLDGETEGLEQIREGYVVTFGSYFGEVLVRNYDGQWAETDGKWVVAVPVGPEEYAEAAAFDIAAASVTDEPGYGSVIARIESAREEGGDPTATLDPDHDVPATPTPADDDVDRVPPGGPTDEQRAELIGQAEELVTTWTEHDLDYSPESLVRLDAFVDDQWDEERFRDASLVADGDPEHVDDAVFTGLVTQLGAYYGEVLVRNYDAAWTDSEEIGRTVVEVQGPDVSAQSNVFHVAEDCLTEPSKFALSHDTVAEQLGIDAPELSSDGTTVQREGPVDGEGATAGSGDAGDIDLDDPDAVEASFRDDAAELVAEWPRYALEYSPNSLVRLDTLVAEEFREFDLEDAELGAEDGDSMLLTAYATEAAGYLAEVFVRNCGAQWRVDGEGPILVVPGGEAEAQLNPIGIAADCLKGEDSFTATYEAVRAQLDLDAEPIDDDAAMDAITRPTGAFVIEADDAGELAAAADAFVADWPEYDLDGTPESLARLDDLVAAVDPETLSVAGVGAYFGRVFVDSYGGEWDGTDEVGWVVGLPDGTDPDPAMLVLPPILRDCLDGEDTFAAVHDAALDRTGTDGPSVADEG